MSNPEVTYGKARANLTREIEIYGHQIAMYNIQRAKHPEKREQIEIAIRKLRRLCEVANLLLNNMTGDIENGVVKVKLSLEKLAEKLPQDLTEDDTGLIWRDLTTLSIRTAVSYRLLDYK